MPINPSASNWIRPCGSGLRVNTVLKGLLMPIYEYRCDSCSHEMEKLQKISDPVLVDCPVCKQASLKRLVSAAAFRLKGSGWYETDFKSGNKKNLAGDSGKEAAPGQKEGADAKKGGDAAKAGVEGLTRQLAYDWGPKGIRVNGVAPTVTMTGDRVRGLW